MPKRIMNITAVFGQIETGQAAVSTDFWPDRTCKNITADMTRMYGMAMWVVFLSVVAAQPLQSAPTPSPTPSPALSTPAPGTQHKDCEKDEDCAGFNQKCYAAQVDHYLYTYDFGPEFGTLPGPFMPSSGKGCNLILQAALGVSLSGSRPDSI